MTSAKKRRSPHQKILIPKKKKIGLVCSGGATKAGAFHLGVMLALQEQGFRFRGGVLQEGETPPPPQPMEISTYVGSSAGSIISSLLASGYSLDAIFDSFLGKDPEDPEAEGALPRLTYQTMFRLRPDFAKKQLKQFLGFTGIAKGLLEGSLDSLLKLKWLKISGLFGTDGIEQYLREEVLPTNDFKKFLPELFIVATDLDRPGKTVFGKYKYAPPPHNPNCVYVDDVNVSESCAASTALPPIFSPYLIRTSENDTGTYYIDGEIRETLSTHIAVDAGADLVIASYTHQPYTFSKHLGSLSDMGLTSILIQSVYSLIEQKINNHVHNKRLQHNAIQAVSEYCEQNHVSEEHRRKIVQILESELHHRMSVDTIYIHPNPEDHRMFFRDHFSLSPRKMADIVRSGFKAAIETLRRYEFEDRQILDAHLSKPA